MLQLYESVEHDVIQGLSVKQVPSYHLIEVKENGLKLHRTGPGDWKNPGIPEDSLKADYIIGVQWLIEKKDIVKIKPKRGIDYFTMFNICLQHPIVSQHLDKCYKIYTDEPQIKVKQDELTENINLFLIHHFLSLINQITQKGLKKGFIQVTENLTAKIKGKILVNPTMRHNHTQGRPDRVYCQYQRFSTDCIENQILASTLEAIQKNINRVSGAGASQPNQLLRKVKPYFEGVQRIPLDNRIFKQVKNHRFYKNYQQAIDVAEQIHKNITQTTEISDKTWIYPFIIDMPELFERYCEVLIRKNHRGLLAGYENKKKAEFKIGSPNLRPDFILKGEGENYIIDSKYKFWYANNNFENFKSDLQQLALYARHKGILKNFIDNDNDSLLEKLNPPTLIFIYPNIRADNSENESGSQVQFQRYHTYSQDINLNQVSSDESMYGFYNMYKLCIDLPQNNNKHQSGTK